MPGNGVYFAQISLCLNCDIFAEQPAERADHAFDQEWPAVVYALLLNLRFIL